MTNSPSRQMERSMRTEQPGDSLPFMLHVGEPDSLWTDASRAVHPTTLVVTPVRLHRRNIETRLREQARPISSLTFTRLRGVAKKLLEAADEPATAADRVDRLAYLRDLLTDPAAVSDHLGAVIGEPLTSHVETLERTRGELELVTGYHPQRMDRLAAALTGDDTPSEPAAVETLDLLAGVSRIHDELTSRLSADTDAGASPATPRVVSETALLARATRHIAATPETWSAAYPSIEQVAVVGTSMLTAPLEDFARVVATRTDVDVQIHLRAASGPAIAEHLDRTAAVDAPGTQEVFSWR